MGAEGESQLFYRPAVNQTGLNRVVKPYLIFFCYSSVLESMEPTPILKAYIYILALLKVI
jgi:hypothetical protein